MLTATQFNAQRRAAVRTKALPTADDLDKALTIVFLIVSLAGAVLGMFPVAFSGGVGAFIFHSTRLDSRTFGPYTTPAHRR